MSQSKGAIADMISKEIQKGVEPELKSLKEKVKKLEHRIREMENNPARVVVYSGEGRNQ